MAPQGTGKKVVTDSGRNEQRNSDRHQLLTRLLIESADAITDFEILELILSANQSVPDEKILAVRLLERFGTLSQTINAEPHELSKIDGVDSTVIQSLSVMRSIVHRVVKSEILDKPLLSSWAKLLDYCKLTYSQIHVEEFRVLFLNGAHELIADEVLHRGTVNHTPVYPREVVKRALELSASGLILLHNHTCGDPQPSKADIEITTKIIEAARTMNITVHDHVIISEKEYYSFKSMGLFG